MTRSSGGTATGGTGASGSGGGSGSGGASGSGSAGAESGRDSRGSKGSKGSKGSVGSAGVAPRDVGKSHLCTFVVAGQKYALSTALIRELVEVTTITTVPRTDIALIGLFNLRGEPMPLVDMAMVLGIGASPPAAKMSVIIVRSEDMSVGARIDALGNVVPNAGLVANSEPNPLLLGFLAGTSGAIAVINPAEFLGRLDLLKRTTSERG